MGENFSRRIVPAIQARWPGLSQVALLGLERFSDAELCEFAAQHGYTICSKDDDFHRLVSSRQYRPKLVHVALGNVSKDRVLAALLAAADDIDAALADPEAGVVVVG